jgi:hypothetical protein
MASGLMALGAAKQPSGKWYNEYSNAGTSQARKDQLYKTYGSRYGWGAPGAAPATGAAPAAAAPAQPATPNPAGQSMPNNLPFSPSGDQQAAIQDTYLQGDANQRYAQLQDAWNRFNQSDPYGSATWEVGPDGRATYRTQLTPEQAFIGGQEDWLDRSKNTTAGDVQTNQFGMYKNALNYDGAQAMPGVNDFGGERQRVEDQLYSRYTSRLDPEYQRQEQALKQNLANRGLTTGSEGWNREMDAFRTSQRDAYADARMQAVQAGGSEQERLFNQALGARQQGVSESNYLRNQPLQEYLALRAPIGSSIKQSNFAAPAQMQFTAPNTAADAVAREGYQTELERARIAAGAVAGGGGGEGEDDEQVSGSTMVNAPGTDRAVAPRGLLSLGNQRTGRFRR